MDWLYEALPIPSSNEDEPVDASTEGGLDVSAHSSGCSTNNSSRATPNSAESHADAKEDLEESEGNDGGVAQLRQRAQKDFLASMPSPEVLDERLGALLIATEALEARLEHFISKKIADDRLAAPASLTQGAKHRGCLAARDAAVPCSGLGKLRSRLRREKEYVRRTREALNSTCGGRCTSPNSPQSSDVAGVAFSARGAAVSCLRSKTLLHFDGVLACLERESGVTGVYVPVGTEKDALFFPSAPRKDAKARRGPTMAGGLAPFKTSNIEVDVVSAEGHRWVKVKMTTHRRLQLEAAVLDANGATSFTDMLVELSRRAAQRLLPHRRTAHVAVVLRYPPPPALARFFVSHGISFTSLLPGHKGKSPRPLVSSDFPGDLPEGSSAWLPSLKLTPSLVCFDTTALVTLCSQSCYRDGFPHSARMKRLSPFHVLLEQQRKEQEECKAVVDVLEPALRRFTTWYTNAELEVMLRRPFLGGCDEANASNGKEPQPASVMEPLASIADEIPDHLILPASLGWLGPLEETAKECLPDTTENPTPLSMPEAPLDESALLREASEHAMAGAGKTLKEMPPSPVRWPNWVMADVTYEEFKWILKTIAGPQEVARAARLLPLISVVDTRFLRSRMAFGGPRRTQQAVVDHHHLFNATKPDSTPKLASGLCGPAEGGRASHVFTPVEYLRECPKVSLRNKAVFGLADAVNAVLLTSNEQMYRAALLQGIQLDVCFHPSRSLTEQKIWRLCRRDGPGKPPAVLGGS